MSTEYRKEYYQKNKEKLNIASKRWQVQNKERFQETVNRWKEAHPEYVLWQVARQRAKRAGMEFAITKDDIVVPETCPYLGCKLTTTKGKGRVWTNASIDRIDTNEGYVPGNIQVISDLANRMKQDATEEQLLAFAKGVLHLHEPTRTGLPVPTAQ